MAAPQHLRQNAFDAIDGAEHVYAEHLLDVGDVRRIEKRWHADARVGNHQLDRAKLLAQGLHGCQGLLTVADICPCRRRRAIFLLNFLCERGKLILAARDETDLVACRGQPLGQGPADAA